MSDGLDDFFAKKDKKRKGKNKVTNNDLLTAEEERPVRKTKKKTKDTEATPAGNNEPVAEQAKAGEPVEEWSEYVEEKETDYSGLRIQSIQIRDEDQDHGDKDKDKAQDGDEEDGEEKSDSASGPWAHVSQPPAPQPVEPPPKKEEPVIVTPNVRSGRYVIPSQRNAAANPEPVQRSAYRRKREAPNLKSEEDFPTLGGGPPDDAGGAWGSGARFEKVKSGGRQMDEATSRGPRLEIGNKYDALRGGAD